MIMRSLSLVLLSIAACGGGRMQTVAYESAPPSAYRGGATATASASGDVIAQPGAAPSDRPGLGTVWGESVYEPVQIKPFTRASSTPWATAVIRYNDDEGVEAQARYFGGSLAPLEIYPGDGAVAVAVESDAGEVLPGFSAGGQTLVVGRDGERYKLVVQNTTDARFEIVASVDGLDVIDGKPAAVDRRGYILEPRGELVIEGFRRTDAEVAAFRFGKVGESYAAQTSGDGNVGVIGVAIFPEEGARWTPGELARRGAADPFPSRSYATPP
jgi:hypothetical protein